MAGAGALVLAVANKNEESALTDIQISLEAGAGLERRLRVAIPASRIQQEFEARLKSTGTSARLKGFRPGKVPTHVVQQRFGPQIRQEVVQELVQSTFAEALGREKLRPVGAPRIEMGAGDAGQDVSYTAIFEVFPEFRVAGVDRLSVEKPEAAITETDIDQTIERLRVHRAEWSAASRPAADGDRVVVDFTGTRYGQPISNGSGTRVPVVIGAGRMVPGFEANLVGMTQGSSRTFTVTFPADYPDLSLRVADVRFEVRVHEVAGRQLPEVNADFIRGFEIASGDMAEFRQLVRENLDREAKAKAQSELRRQIIDSLLGANPVEVPAALVGREAEGLRAEAMKSMGVTDPKDAPAMSTFEEAARRRARTGLILSALIREQDLKVDPARVDEKLGELCEPYDRPEDVRNMYLQSPELMAEIEGRVLEEQVLGWLLGKAQVTAKAVGFAELMGV